ncbi:Ankyrin-2 [Dactylella cylindrospora]|nr:Ankyrin-2 [Dactylella cylindrospora]
MTMESTFDGLGDAVGSDNSDNHKRITPSASTSSTILTPSSSNSITSTRSEGSGAPGSSFDDHYRNLVSEQRASTSQQPVVSLVQNQGAFLNLALRLGIPILDKSSNYSGGTDHIFVGEGTSYHVTQALHALNIYNPHANTININPGANHSRLDASVAGSRYVTKRIVPRDPSRFSDADQLAAITQEVRILGNKAIQQSERIVRLFAIAWDEIPAPNSRGRLWPRLLLEAADCGNLQDFLTSWPESKLWVVKIDLITDVANGLRALHSLRVVHLDLKPENVLIYLFQQKDPHNPVPIKYQARICDFGFSVVQQDYDNQDNIFSKRVGTEPWCPPELSVRGQGIEIRNLPKSDIYCFGMLMSRVFMNGGNPLGSMSIEEVQKLKNPVPSEESNEGEAKDSDNNTEKSDEDENLYKMWNTILDSVFAATPYTWPQREFITRHLVITLSFNPENRYPLDVIHRDLIFYGMIFSDAASEKHVEELTSQLIQERDLLPGSSTEEAEGMIETFSVLSWIKTTFRKTVDTIFASAFRAIRPFYRRALTVGTYCFALGLRFNGWPYDAFQSTSELYSSDRIEAQLIERDIASNLGEFGEIKRDVPNLEASHRLHTANLPAPTQTEISEALKEQAEDPRGEKAFIAAEATYQLAIASFEGIGVSKNRERGLELLEQAALRGSKKALRDAANLFDSMKTPMSSNLTEAVCSARLKGGQDELLRSFADVLNNQRVIGETYTALGSWIEASPDDYYRYLDSEEYGFIKLLLFVKFLFCNIDAKPHSDPDFVFGSLEGHDVWDEGFLTEDKKEEFVHTVKSHKWTNEVDRGRLTLLQVAAAKGDLLLAQVLIENLKAEIDACGIYPGFTPFIISIMCGNFNIAMLLANNGADISQKEPAHNRTIFHFLNQFESGEVPKLLEIGLKTGLQLEETDDIGNTPLLSTFTGWDISRRAAARSLQQMGASILVRNSRNWSPLIAATRDFDIQSMEAILEELYSPISCSLELVTSDPQEASAEKATAFHCFRDLKEFSRRRVAGATFKSDMKRALDLLIDPGMLEEYPKCEFSEGKGVLISACSSASEDIVEALLESENCPDVNARDLYGYTALHWAAERNCYASVLALLKAGADPLIVDKRNRTVFHVLAQFAPEHLLRLIEDLESDSRIWSHGVGMQSVMTTKRGSETPWMILVLEGSEKHLEVAEVIRQMYGLDYDSYQIQKEGVDITDTTGNTLLHYAVDIYHNADLASNPAGYELLTRLLRAYPDREHFERKNSRGWTALHLAAWNANWVAIEILRDHMNDIYETPDVNMLDGNGVPPLQICGQVWETLKVKEEDTEGALATIVKKNTAKAWKILRNMGASTMEEKEGAIVHIQYTPQDQLAQEEFVTWVEATSEFLGIIWEFKEGMEHPPYYFRNRH